MSGRWTKCSWLGLLTALVVASGGCGAGLARFPRRPIVWDDADRQPFGPMPEERWVPYYWDAADHLIFRPAAEAWLLELSREAINVNAVDEVPDSSFFVNRIGRAALTPAELTRGACGSEVLDAPTPWTIVGGKPAGASPGFIIRDAAGVRYLMKTDRPGQPELSTGADALASAAFHAAGYHVPCYRVADLDPAALVIELGATTTLFGHTRLITDADVATVVAAAVPAPNGLRRVVLSRFIDARPLGPWDFVGTWDEDPNDVVPHEHRRELRGIYVLDAWLNHWDARQENTLAGWVEAGGGGYVRHYLIDFGESLGLAERGERASTRFGHTTYLDLGQIMTDAVGLGIVARPWDGRTRRDLLAYYDVEHFDPGSWTPQYWNGALDRRTEADLAWGARLLARFDDALLDALVALARLTDADVEAHLRTTLAGRRERLLRRYLTRLSPLTDPEVRSAPTAGVCLVDLAVTSGIAEAGARTYEARASDARVGVSVELDDAEAGRICVALSGVDGAGADADYLVVEVRGATASEPREGLLELHFYRTGPDRIELAGLRRRAP